jgi:carbonic anhydrase
LNPSAVRVGVVRDVDADVRQLMARIEASPFVPDKSSVRGFVYDVKTGRLREVT